MKRQRCYSVDLRFATVNIDFTSVFFTLRLTSVFDESQLNQGRFVSLLENFVTDETGHQVVEQLVNFIHAGYVETEEEKMSRLARVCHFRQLQRFILVASLINRITFKMTCRAFSNSQQNSCVTIISLRLVEQSPTKPCTVGCQVTIIPRQFFFFVMAFSRM